jgi:hypothetical protein
VNLTATLNGAQGATRRAASLRQRLLAFSRRQTLDPKVIDIGNTESALLNLCINARDAMASGIETANRSLGQNEARDVRDQESHGLNGTSSISVSTGTSALSWLTSSCAFSLNTASSERNLSGPFVHRRREGADHPSPVQ